MKVTAFVFLFLLVVLPVSSNYKEANELYNQKKYAEAIILYKQLMEKYPDNAELIQFNLAQCYLKMDSTGTALTFLHNAAKTQNKETQSTALNTIGYLILQNDKKREALEYFRKALEANPQNETARYNYELLLKQLGTQKDDSETPPEPEEDEDDPTSAQEWRKKFNFYLPPPNSEGLPTIHHYDSIPIEKAKELLEALRAEEVKFLQQLRKSRKTPDKEKGSISEW